MENANTLTKDWFYISAIRTEMIPAYIFRPVISFQERKLSVLALLGWCCFAAEA